MEAKCLTLEELKKEYEKLKKKHNLPIFKGMNEDFEIEKLQEKETELLLREVRRIMIEKNRIDTNLVKLCAGQDSNLRSPKGDRFTVYCD